MIQEADTQIREELARKYKAAGKMRFIIFLLLLLFLTAMKYLGGYSYIDTTFIALICVEALLNQPYNFLLRRTDIRRFQYYQMTVDIISISWIINYMGGLEAPIINIAYYAIILWAGVVSTTGAVFFAVILSAISFSSIILLEHFKLIPFINFYEYKMPAPQMIGLLLGHISFLFAFGYFSAYSSKVIKLMQRKRQEESLRNANKLSATGSLMGHTAHDILNQLACIKGYVDVLLADGSLAANVRQMLESIRKLEIKGADLLQRLAAFSKTTGQKFDVVDLHKIFDDALEVCWPLIRYSKVKVEKELAVDLPNIMANKDQLQEVFVVFIINAIDAILGEGKFTFKTIYNKERDLVEITLSDTGKGIRKEDLKRLGEPFFTTKGSGKGFGLGLATAYGIISRHSGVVDVESKVGIGTTFRIKLPIKQTQSM